MVKCKITLMFWLFLSFILFFSPGFWLVKIIWPTKEKISYSLLISLTVLLSLALIPVVFFLISLLKPLPLTSTNCWLIILLLNLVLISISNSKKIPVINRPKVKDLWSLVIILLELILLLAPYFRPHLGPFWTTFHSLGARDIEKHVGVIVILLKEGFPAKNPFILDQPLNYYYFYHLDAAVLSVLSQNTLPPQLVHLLLSALILTSSILLSSAFLSFLICLTLFLGYGFDFFPMLLFLFKIHPYPDGLDHVDQLTIPFAKDLKVNPISVWFQWVPQHALALFLFLLFLGIFHNLIKIEKKWQQPILALLILAILGSSVYVFLGGLVTILLFWFYQQIIHHQEVKSNYSFLFLTFPFCLLLMLPMTLRIKTPTITLYPFWQLPRDHLFTFKFSRLPTAATPFLLTFFLIERFGVYFFDLGLLLVLAILFWKKSPKNNLTTFAKIMLLTSTLISVLLKSVPFNNDLCYRVSGLSWLACAFLVNNHAAEIWDKIKRNFLIALILSIIIFSPTVVEQFILPYQKISPDFWELKNFVNQNISEKAIVQAPLNFSTATIYSLERKMVYHPIGLIFYPPKEVAEKIKNDITALFTSSPEESERIAANYQINYLLIKNQNYPFTKSLFFRKVFSNASYSLYHFEEPPPKKQI